MYRYRKIFPEYSPEYSNKKNTSEVKESRGTWWKDHINSPPRGARSKGPGPAVSSRNDRVNKVERHPARLFASLHGAILLLGEDSCTVTGMASLSTP